MIKLKTLVEDTLAPPRSRIGSAANAKTFVDALRTDEDTRQDRRTKIQGIIDGNQPWSKATLVGKGQGHRTNLNLREAEGAVEAAKTPYYDLVFEVPRFTNITYDLPEVDSQISAEWGEIMSDEFHELLDQWDSFDSLMQLHQYQMVTFGVGPIFWPRQLDWRSDTGKAGRILVPMRTKANTDKMSVAAILHTFGAEELYGLIKNAKEQKSSRDAGWNPVLCKKEIMKAGKEGVIDTSTRGAHWEDYQSAIRNGDLFYALNQSNDIQVASLFVKDFSGKISHYIIGIKPDPAIDDLSDKELNDLKDDESPDDMEVGYLFKKRDLFASFSEVICPFFFDVGPDGTWHSIKGLGPKIYDFCDVSNRVTSQMIDGAVIGSGVALEAQDANALQETQAALFGGWTVFAPGLKVVQTRIAESLNGAIAVKRELQNTLQSNTGSYRQRVSGEQEEPTLGQAQLNAQQQAVLSKGAVNRYYVGLDKFYRETLRRALDKRVTKSTPGGEMALAFRARCERKGIPPEFINFEAIAKVKAQRSIGYGSPQIRDMATKEVISLIPFMDEVSRNNALRMRAAAIPGVGQANVDSLFPSVQKKGFPDDHAALATLENNALRTPGGQTEVTPQQNHATHFETHAKDAFNHLQQMQGGQGQNGSAPTPAQNGSEMHPQAPDVLIHLEQAGPHLQEHLNKLAGDPSREQQVAGYGEIVQQLSDISNGIAKDVQQFNYNIDQQDAQSAPQPDPKAMADLAKMFEELKLKGQRQAGELRLKDDKQAHSSRLADLKTASDIRRKNAIAAAEVHRKNAQTASEARRANVSTAHDIRRENISTAHDIRRANASAASEMQRKKATATTKEE